MTDIKVSRNQAIATRDPGEVSGVVVSEERMCVCPYCASINNKRKRVNEKTIYWYKLKCSDCGKEYITHYRPQIGFALPEVKR